MKRIPAWLTYTVLRLVFFAVPFAALWALGFQAWLAAILAAVIALSLSIIFLSRFRNATSTQMASTAEARKQKKSSKALSDEDVEDSLS